MKSVKALDDLDRRLLIAKENDPLGSNRSLARAANVSTATAMVRLRQMEEDGVFDVKRASVIDPGAVGFGLDLHFYLTLTNGRMKSRVVRSLNRVSAVRQSWVSGGNSLDLVVHVMVADMKQLRVVHEEIGQIEGVQRIRSEIILNRNMHQAKVPLGALTEFARILTNRRHR